MEISVFDGHCDTILRCWETGQDLADNDGAVDLTRGGRFGRYCQFFALFSVDDPKTGKNAHQAYEEQYALFCRQMEAHSDAVVQCRNGEDAQQAHRQGKIAAFLSVEGAHSLNCDLDQLRLAYARGVRAVNLTWNNPNLLSGTNCQERSRGLSGQGRAFVREMERLGMLVDVSHLSDPGFWDVLEMARRPVIASHSNARAVCPHTRNLTDEQFTAIIKNQGVVGLNLCREFVSGREDVDALTAHLEHFLALGGEHTVALGGDLDGCEPVKGVPDIAGWAVFYERLLQLNYKESLLEHLFYHNFMRVVSQL